MFLLRSDLVTALALSVVLHLLVIGLVSFSWSIDPELQRAPPPPTFVQAVVMEKQPQSASRPKPAPKPAVKPAPKPEPKPDPKPAAQPKPAPKPAPAPAKAPAPPPAKPAPAFSQPNLSELLAREELDMAEEQEAGTVTDQTQGDASRDAETDKQVASHMQAIQRAIINRWVIPATARLKDDLVAQVRVHVLPGGEVLDVALVKSSGDAAFDESVKSAIHSVGTLPVPSGELFHEFRVMRFEFNPRMKSQ